MRALCLRSAALIALALAMALMTGRVALADTPTPPPGSAVQRLDPAYQVVSLAQASFPVDVRVEGAANLGAYEVLLTFDSASLGFVSVSNGPFLASTGRTAFCTAPVLQLLPGTLRKLQYGCGTFGAPPPAGPSGDGLLATVTFAPLVEGLTDLALEPSLSDPFGAPLAAVAFGGQVDITPGPTPTPTNTTTPTVTPTPCPGGLCPTPTPVQCAPTTVRPQAGVSGSPAVAFDVPITVENGCDIGAFALSLAWDPGVLEFVSAAPGAFLGSTGRTVQCTPAQQIAAGDLRVSCVTLGGAPPPGAAGMGTLAVVRFIGLQVGNAQLDVHDVSLLRPDASTVPAAAVDGSVDIVPCAACPTVTPTHTPSDTPTTAPTNTNTATPTPTACPGACPTATTQAATATQTLAVPAAPASLRVAPAAITASQGGAASVAVIIEGASNVGAFSFVASWDPAKASLLSVSAGPFLGSTGRPVFCNQTTTGLPPGAVRFLCGSLGSTLAGAGGSGVLAVLSLAALQPGTVPLVLSDVALTTPAAVALAVGSVSNGALTIVPCGGPCPTSTPTPVPTATPVTTPSGVALVAVSPASFSVSPGDVFETTLTVSGVADLGAFEVTFEYNTPPAVTLALESWTPGPFLGSTGRPVFCQPPVVDNFALRLGCATFGSAAPGASGGGELGRLRFRALGYGIVSSFGVQAAALGDPLANSIAVQWAAPSAVVVSPPTPTPTAGGGASSFPGPGGGGAYASAGEGFAAPGGGAWDAALFGIALLALVLVAALPRGLARLAGAAVAGAVAFGALAGGGAESGIELRPEPHGVSVYAGGGTATVDQRISGAGTGVASFTLRYRSDPSVIAVAFADGGYLGSNGRAVSCSTAAPAPFTRVLACTTSGSGAYPTGDGVLARASIAAAPGVDLASLADGGRAAVHMEQLTVRDADGAPLFVEGAFDIAVDVRPFSGDADADCDVDAADLQQTLAAYATQAGAQAYAARLDMDADDDVDIHDAQSVLGRIGASCSTMPPPPPAALPVPPALADDDGDGVLAAADNCPPLANELQGDADGDALGDACEGAAYATLADDADTDGDGCRDGIEARWLTYAPAGGGHRDPAEPFDFFDTTGDGSIDLGDTLLILEHFGHRAPYDGLDGHLDRVATDPGAPWRSAAAADGIDLSDALLNLASFGHACLPPS